MSCRSRLTAVLVIAATVTAAGSCSPLRPEGASLLGRLQLPPDSVALEIYFIRVPFGQPDANQTLWQQVDEQQLPNDLRRRLVENGFRAGLVSSQPPEVLSKLMELKDKPAPTPGKATQVKIAEMDQEPRVVRRFVQLRSGKRSEIIASDIYDELPVLTREPGGVCGHTYPKAQGLLALKAVPEADGQTRLNLVPEIHYGEPRQRYVGQGAALILEAGRARKVFDELTITAGLLPGHMLLISSLDSRPGTLGHQFFTCKSNGRVEQKLLLIRLAQTQHDSLFDPGAGKALPEEKLEE
jgi:hypothetical protein